MSYVVESLMALVDCEGGATVTVMQGGLVPEGVLPSHLGHLIERGLVVEAAFEGGLAPTMAGDLSDVFVPAYVNAPPKVAAKAAWVEHALSQGAPQDEIDNSTKEQLIEKYGS